MPIKHRIYLWVQFLSAQKAIRHCMLRPSSKRTLTYERHECNNTSIEWKS